MLTIQRATELFALDLHDTIARVQGLSPREGDILAHIAMGYTPREIARRLGISARTVNSFRSGIKRKLGLAADDDGLARLYFAARVGLEIDRG